MKPAQIQTSEASCLAALAVADPQLAATVAAGLAAKDPPIPVGAAQLLVAETIRAFNQEASFGAAVAAGYLDLAGDVPSNVMLRYRDGVRAAGRNGPALGRIVATCLVPVLKYGDERLFRNFWRVLKFLQASGSHTLAPSLEALARILRAGDPAAAAAYLGLLGTVFSNSLSYWQSRHFAAVLPGAVEAFAAPKRAWQTRALQRVGRADFQLADALLTGLENGLQLLSESALHDFISRGLAEYDRSPRVGVRFLALESETGRAALAGLQVTAAFYQVRSRINRYLHARTGLRVSIRPRCELGNFGSNPASSAPEVVSDGRFIYLPEEIDMFTSRRANLKLYNCLARLESAFYEFGTFDFDFEKVQAQGPGSQPGPNGRARGASARPGAEGRAILKLQTPAASNISDLELFLGLFPIRALAGDLFTIFELARIRVLLARRYPGLVRRCYCMLRDEALRIIEEHKPLQPLFLLYARLALDMRPGRGFSAGGRQQRLAGRCVALFAQKISENCGVETSADLVGATYRDTEAFVKKALGGRDPSPDYPSLKVAFGWRPWPHPFFCGDPEFEHRAAVLKARLARQGLAVSKAAVKKRLLENNGVIGIRDICTLSGAKSLPAAQMVAGLDEAVAPAVSIKPSPAIGCVFHHREWDFRLQDYLPEHVRLQERTISGRTDDFYARVLQRHHGLVTRLRRAFEFLKPRGIKILRPWVEGDEFDYRALLDFAVDKKAGRMPSERLYIKRLKAQRDVAVLLLVDVSHSTSNRVSGSRSSVLDVEKTAVVLFAEALKVVGDSFAIAGFSGTGRLGVDYYRVKDFDEFPGEAVRQRISALRPERSTRMGAAIRHAARRLAQAPARVRLLIVLGDGFPNDVDYKRQYAIADTRRALLEARSQNIYTHAITVNMAATPQLDALYGPRRHNAISDVRQLPGQLLRIYGSLTG